MDQRGLWFDGQIAVERSVRVRQDPRFLTLSDELGVEHQIVRSELVRVGASGGRIKLGHRSIEGWRLILTKPVDPAILSGLPQGGSLGPIIGRKKIAILSGISFLVTAAVGMVIFAPEAIAKHMPLAWERKLGAAFDLPIEATRCADPGAQAALNRIVDRLDPKARDDGFTVELADLDIANAAALPGGRMIVLNGLFEDIDNPDAIAGIVAHEIAHVRRRHVAAAMVRQLGMGTVVTLLGGGSIASNAGGLLSLKFTRSAEAEADADAIAMLAKAGIDPRPTGAAFNEFRKHEGDWPEWLGDHPASAGRATLFAGSYDKKRHYRPVLTSTEAKALMAGCR
jgi:Zn-dependent protease with chaperone function